MFVKLDRQHCTLLVLEILATMPLVISSRRATILTFLHFRCSNFGTLAGIRQFSSPSSSSPLSIESNRRIALWEFPIKSSSHTHACQRKILFGSVLFDDSLLDIEKMDLPSSCVESCHLI